MEHVDAALKIIFSFIYANANNFQHQRVATKSTYRSYVDQANGKGDHDYGEGENFARVLSFLEKETEFVHEACYYAFQTSHL